MAKNQLLKIVKCKVYVWYIVASQAYEVTIVSSTREKVSKIVCTVKDTERFDWLSFTYNNFRVHKT